MDNNFGFKLDSLRIARNLTMQQLADLAGISGPLVSNLISGKRVIGERTARKLGIALQLSGEELDDFIYQAINNCTEKVLNSSKAFPAELINLVTCELNSLGITPEKVKHCVRHPELEANAALFLTNGKTATVRVEVAVR